MSRKNQRGGSAESGSSTRLAQARSRRSCGAAGRGSDQATRLMFKNYHPKSWYFEDLDRHFCAPKSPRKIPGISGAPSCHRLLSPHALSPYRQDILDRKKKRLSTKWTTPKVLFGSPNGDRISQRLIDPCLPALGDGSLMIY